jgi:hypothetical protein
MALAEFATLPEAWLLRLGGLENIQRLLSKASDIYDQRRPIVCAPVSPALSDDPLRFVEQLTTSFDVRLAGALVRLKSDLRVLTFRSNAGFRLDDRSSLTASVTARPRFLRRPAIDGIISQGAYCAIDDIWATATCEPGFLSATGCEAFPTMTFATPLQGRYFDYGGAFSSMSLDVLGLFTARAPLAPDRLALAAVLSEISIRWVLAHELAHELLGHFEYLRSCGANRLSFTDSPLEPTFSLAAPARPSWQDTQALEMQADWLATNITMMGLAVPDSIEAWPLVMWHRVSDSKGGSLDVTNPFVRLRVGLVAALGSVLALEFAPNRPSGVSHPQPSARVLNILVGGHDVYELLMLENGFSDHVSLRKCLASAIVETASDLDILSRAAELPAPAYLIGSLDDLLPGGTSLASDALTVIARQPVAGGRLVTPSGQNYAELRTRAINIWSRLDRWRMGSMADANPFDEDLTENDRLHIPSPLTNRSTGRE